MGKLIINASATSINCADNKNSVKSVEYCENRCQVFHALEVLIAPDARTTRIFLAVFLETPSGHSIVYSPASYSKIRFACHWKA